MSSDKMRESFEAQFPVPDGVYWKASGLYYVRNLEDDEAVSWAVEWNTMLDVWQAAHAAALPPGFVAVPVDPTEYMLEAAEESLRDHGFDAVDVGEFDKAAMWADMLAARPKVK